MKQETIEEAAENYGIGIGNKNGTAQFDFIKGAKWQQKRSYSEQEVFNLLMDFWMEQRNQYKLNPECVSNWFETFKKK